MKLEPERPTTRAEPPSPQPGDPEYERLRARLAELQAQQEMAASDKDDIEQCEGCGDEFDADDLNADGLCAQCEDDEASEEAEEPRPDMTTPEPATAEPASRRLHWLVVAPLSLWCLCWCAVNGYDYLYLTWRLFARLKWASFALLINPCFVIWLALFSSVVWAPLNLSWLPWGKDFKLGKVALLALFAPPLLGLALHYVGPYFYPITWGEDGHSMFLRYWPIIGGKGYN